MSTIPAEAVSVAVPDGIPKFLKHPEDSEKYWRHPLGPKRTNQKVKYPKEKETKYFLAFHAEGKKRKLRKHFIKTKDNKLKQVKLRLTTTSRAKKYLVKLVLINWNRLIY